MSGKNNMPRRQIHLGDEEESESSLLTPTKPFQNTGQLYVMHFFFAFVSRMWDMGIVLLVAQLTNNSLFLIALTGLLSSVCIFLFMPTIGGWLDKTNRITAVRFALSTKFIAVTGAYFVCVYLDIVAAEKLHTNQTEHAAFSSVGVRDLHRIMLYSLPVLAAIASMSFSAIVQSIEKDWIVVLSNRDSKWLSNTNSVMTQIDLGCKSLAPALTGFLFAWLTHTQTAVVLLIVNAAAVLALYMFMDHLYHAWPALGQKVGVDIIDAATDLLASDGEEIEEGTAGNSSGKGRSSVGGRRSSSSSSNAGRAGAGTGGNNSTRSSGATSVRTPAQYGSTNNNNNTPPPTSTKNSSPMEKRMSMDAQMVNKAKKGKMGSGLGSELVVATGAAGSHHENNIDNEENEDDGEDVMWYYQNPQNKSCTSYFCCSCCRPCVKAGSRVKHYFRDFAASGCVGVMLSYAALYLTVLSFGSLMTVYVRWAGVTDDYIGIYRGISALSGYLGAVLFPYFTEAFGLYASAQIAIVYQFILVAIAASSYFWASSEQVSVYCVIYAVLFSRTGLWVFDLCARQIAQETIPERVRGKVNGQWRAIVAFFDMITYLIAIFIPNPEDFWILTTVSALMIGFALLVFTVTNPYFSEGIARCYQLCC